MMDDYSKNVPMYYNFKFIRIEEEYKQACELATKFRFTNQHSDLGGTRLEIGMLGEILQEILFYVNGTMAKWLLGQKENYDFIFDGELLNAKTKLRKGKFIDYNSNEVSVPANQKDFNTTLYSFFTIKGEPISDLRMKGKYSFLTKKLINGDAYFIATVTHSDYFNKEDIGRFGRKLWLHSAGENASNGASSTKDNWQREARELTTIDKTRQYFNNVPHKAVIDVYDVRRQMEKDKALNKEIEYV